MSGLNYRLIEPPTVEPISLAAAKHQCRIDPINHDDDEYLTNIVIPAARERCENHCNISFFNQTYELYLDSFPYGDYRSTIPIDQRSPWNYSAYWSDLAIRLPKPRTISINSMTYIDADFNQQTLNAYNRENASAGGYYADLTSKPARIVPPPGGTWPITQFYMPGSIVVQYVAGSFTFVKTENVAISGTQAPYIGTLSKLNVGITSVKDINGNALAYTTQPVVNSNGDATGPTQLSLTAAPPTNVAVVTYTAGVCPPTVVQAISLLIGHYFEHREEIADTTQLKQLPEGVKSLLRKHRFNVLGNFRSGF